MSEINPTPQPNPIAEGSLSADTWEIWTHPKLITPRTFLKIFSNISTYDHLTDVLQMFTEINYSSNFEFIFCRKGVTPGQLDSTSTFGIWEDFSPLSIDMSMENWKKLCTIMLMTYSNMQSLNIYGLKIKDFPNGQPKIFCWKSPENN